MKHARYILLVPFCFVLQGCTTLRSDPERFEEYAYCQIRPVFQSNRMACGAACLSAVLRYWDRQVSEAEILLRYPARKSSGYTLGELRSIALEKGVLAFVLSFEESDLLGARKHVLKGWPLIVGIRMPAHKLSIARNRLANGVIHTLARVVSPNERMISHFVILLGIHPTKNSVLVFDPAEGKREIPGTEFCEMWERMSFASLLCIEPP